MTRLRSDMYEIEHGVAIPDKRYPFSELKVGDSFFIPFEDPSSKAENMLVSSAVSSSASHKGKILGRKFTMRTLYDGVRVWRVS